MKLYDLSIFCYHAFLRLAAFFHPKAKAFIKGRKNWKEKIRNAVPETGFDLWLHCASLGEFEQGQPILQKYKENHPKASILLSFYSPSGYEKQANNPLATHVSYLPVDTKNNARDWVNLVKPKQVIFIKYEFWFNVLEVLKAKKIDTHLAAAVFHEDHFFNKFPGNIFLNRLEVFKNIFFQIKPSFNIPNKISTHVVGDPRVDRVIEIQEKLTISEQLNKWSKGRTIFVWGSVWKEDFEMIKWMINDPKFQNFSHLIAPHSLDPNTIDGLLAITGDKVDLFTKAKYLEQRIVILDTIGQLSRSYRIGTFAYIGGGFGKGLHNILEPLAAGLPTLFGPKNQGFPEVRKSIQADVGFQVNQLSEFKDHVTQLKEENFSHLKNKTKAFINSEKGATEKILTLLENEQITKEKP